MGNKEIRFYESLREYAAYCGRAGVVLDDVMAGNLTAEEGFEALRNVKRDARRSQAVLLERMFKAFKNPIRLSEVRVLLSKFDSIINIIKDALNQMTIYEKEEIPEGIHTMAHLIHYALDEIVKVVNYTEDIEVNLMKMEARCQRIYNMEERGDSVCRETLKDLFYGNHDPLYVVRWKEILQDLEQVLDSTAGTVPLLQRMMSF